jgi:MFS family permease
VSGRHRLIVAALLVIAVLAGGSLVAFASVACPVDTEASPCPEAGRNLVVGVTMAAIAAAALVAAFAFLGEVLARRRIVYRGAWRRAARRGALAGLVVATLAGLRLGGALSVPVGLFVLVVAGAVEWLAIQRDPWR